RAGPTEMRLAKSELMQRYSGAIYRYLIAILRDEHAADEVFQEFALQLVKGGFHGATPQAGRFRDYVKISLLRLISRYRRAVGQRERVLEALPELECDAGLEEAFDEQFNNSCRDELMSRAWDRLKRFERESGQGYFTVLDFRARHPELSSDGAAAELSRPGRLGREISSAAVRKLLQRARVKFAELLIDEVQLSLDDVSDEQLELRLIELKIHRWCEPALRRRGV
ncbi:MAG: sigma-70 family RNA polymerase sigma factor, partial [Planctomycetales bacterium]|nr:sigma-70 family RNA polymerase sigma factor [Planctomycetales bacterium]